MKTILKVLFLLTLTCVALAQDGTIKWSEEYKDRGYYSVIGESKSAFFVERKYNTRLNDRDVDVELLRFDQELELTHAVEVRDIEKSSYESIATINSPEGLAHVYYQTSNRGEQFVSAQLFDHENLRKTEIVDLARFKIMKGSKQVIQQDGNYQFTYPLDILLSRDKTKMAIMHDQERVGKSDLNYYQYYVIDLSNGFTILHSGDFYSDNESQKYALSDKHLSDSGKLTYAIKKYVRNNDTEHINKKPAYDYEIHHMSGDTMEYIYDIKVRKEYMDRLILGSDDEDNIYISGYIRKKPFGNITKSFFMSLDPLGYERYTLKDTYTKRDIKKIIGKDDDELDENFQSIDIFPADDIIYLVRQYRRRGARNSTFNNGFYSRRQFNQINNLVYHWEYDEVVIEGIGRETGEILWTKVNPREHEDDNIYSRYFTTGQMELRNNNLYFIYNEREENIQKIRRKENLKRTDIPGNRTSITIARINSNGDLQYKVVDKEDYYHLPEKGVLLGENAIYFINHHKNYKKFFLVMSDLSILDF